MELQLRSLTAVNYKEFKKITWIKPTSWAKFPMSALWEKLIIMLMDICDVVGQ
jgi:hypothetical protein